MSNEMNQQPRKRGPMGRMGRGMQPGEKPKDLKNRSNSSPSTSENIKLRFYCYDLCRMLNGVQRCRTKDSRKSYDRTVRGTDGKDPGHRKH